MVVGLIGLEAGLGVVGALDGEEEEGMAGVESFPAVEDDEEDGLVVVDG